MYNNRYNLEISNSQRNARISKLVPGRWEHVLEEFFRRCGAVPFSFSAFSEARIYVRGWDSQARHELFTVYDMSVGWATGTQRSLRRGAGWCLQEAKREKQPERPSSSSSTNESVATHARSIADGDGWRENGSSRAAVVPGTTWHDADDRPTDRPTTGEELSTQ
ncbi:unnamed protein product [Soboliphyme baturini]|uniref:RRM domain-containing protein n=1 Tax=Soboliphyme baturini TaxID=241478 RepID=A0A183IB22_9BILA|nr:unnamed protein product [Soboliphyme baturini]